MEMKKIIALMLAVLMLLGAFTACNPSSSQPSSDPSANASGDPAPENTPASPNSSDAPEVNTARTDLKLATTVPMDGCDPHFNTAIANDTAIGLIYESLVSVDSYMNVEPMLCESYEILEGGLVYEYKLKQGVTFHNGEEMKASDVVFSLNRAKESPTMYSTMALVESIDEVDEYTVRIKLVVNYAPFYHLIGNVSIVSEKACTEAGDEFVSKPCGTGAWTIGEWTAEKVVFKKFEGYHGELPKLDTITISTVSDASTALMAFEAGEIDYISAPKSDIDRMLASGKYAYVTVPTNNTTYITFNNEVAPFDNVLVRQAVAYAINRDEILLGSTEGYAVQTNTIGNPEYTVGLSEDVDFVHYDQDIAKAKDLLAQAGYADGIDLGKLMVMSGSDEYSLVAEIMKNQLAAAGINIEIQLTEASAFVTDAITGNYGIAIMGVTLGSDMAEHELHYCSYGINQLNLPRFSNARVDELFGLAMTETDIEAREALYAEALNIVNEQAAIIPLQQSITYIFMDPALVMDPNMHINTWYWAAE